MAWVVKMVEIGTFLQRRTISPIPVSHSWKWVTTMGVGPGNRVKNWGRGEREERGRERKREGGKERGREGGRCMYMYVPYYLTSKTRKCLDARPVNQEHTSLMNQ